MTVHQIDTDQVPASAADDDLLLLRDGDDVRVGRVGGGEVAWLGSVPAASLPLDGDEAALEIAAKGVESALVERGG